MKALNKLSNLENVSINYDSTVKGKDAKSVFLDNWDNAKIALVAIETMVKNPIVKLIIGIIVSVGDGIKAKI